MFFNRPDFPDGLRGGLQLALTGPPNSIPDFARPAASRRCGARHRQPVRRRRSEHEHPSRVSTATSGREGGDGIPVRRYELVRLRREPLQRLARSGGRRAGHHRSPLRRARRTDRARSDPDAEHALSVVDQGRPHHHHGSHARRLGAARGQRLGGDERRTIRLPGRSGALAEPVPAAPPFPNPLPPAFSPGNRIRARSRRSSPCATSGSTERSFRCRRRAARTPSCGRRCVRRGRLFADVADPRLAVQGGSSARRAPSRDITGWIQIDGPIYHTLSKAERWSGVRVPASASDVFGLLSVLGPARAPIALRRRVRRHRRETGPRRPRVERRRQHAPTTT